MAKNSKPRATPRKKVGTELDALLRQAVQLSHELDELERQNKLTAKAMLREARGIAGIDGVKQRQLVKVVEEADGGDHAKAFIGRLAQFIASPNCSRCPRDPTKLLRVYGSDSAGVELRELGLRVADALVVAVAHAAERFPARFGQIDDFDAHQRELQSTRKKLGAIYEQMADAVTGRDLNIDTRDLTPTERDAGLARVTFRRHPLVNFANPDWAQALVASEKRRYAGRAAA